MNCWLTGKIFNLELNTKILSRQCSSLTMAMDFFFNFHLSLLLIVSPGNSLPLYWYCKKIRHQGRYLNWNCLLFIFSWCRYCVTSNQNVSFPFHVVVNHIEVYNSTPFVVQWVWYQQKQIINNTWYVSATMFILWFVLKYLICFRFRYIFPVRNNFFVFFFAFAVVLRSNAGTEVKRPKIYIQYLSKYVILRGFVSISHIQMLWSHHRSLDMA